jgi:AcrR family transcriptional regulator
VTRPIGRVETRSRPLTPRTETPSSRDKILDVAEALFARRGFAGVGIQEVADAVGLGKSSLFHHFRSKAHLYLAVLHRVLGRIEERLAPALGAAGEPAARLDACIEALVDALAEHPTTARLLLRGLFEDDDFGGGAAQELRAAEETLARILGRFDRLLRDGVEAGAFHAVSAAHTIQTLVGATVYHFASGEFGEGLLGRPLFSAEAVRRRKAEVKGLLRRGLVRPTETGGSR